jgi:SAM-dependent methyltransferase
MKEIEIRDPNAHNRYLALVEKDCVDFFSEADLRHEVPCPACGSDQYFSQFRKVGFHYVTCEKCETLYARTRPPREKLGRFYDTAVSTKFWINDFFKPVAEARRAKIFEPRAAELAMRFGADPRWTIGDIGAGFGLFLDEMRKIWPAGIYWAIEPSSEQAELCRQMGVAVRCSMLEELEGLDGTFDLLTGFELLEHLYDPRDFLSGVFRLLKPGGRFLSTTLSGHGFDIQVLWERSKAVYPPCHLNFLNPDSLVALLNSLGFVVEEIATPGKLDWDIVEGMIRGENFDPGRFWNLFSKKGSEMAKRTLQEWIRENGFSSHMRVLAQRPLVTGRYADCQSKELSCQP